MGIIRDIFFGSAEQMPVFHGWEKVTQKYQIVGDPKEISIGLLVTRDEAARNYASGIEDANAAVIEDAPAKNELQKTLNKYRFTVYPIKIG